VRDGIAVDQEARQAVPFEIMGKARIDFESVQWDAPAPGVRSKSFIRNGKKLRLVEFSHEFTEQEWCIKGHIGYVLEGELEIAFINRVETFVAGDGIFIAGGDDERHKAKVITPLVRLLLTEEG